MLERQFNLAMLPYRAFLMIMEPDEQRQALWRIRDHLVDGGRLVMNNEDVRFEPIVDNIRWPEAPLHKHCDFVRPDNGNRVFVWNSIRYDLTRQAAYEDRIFEEVDGTGRVVDRHYTTLTWRYSTRYELQYLLELCGFEIEALYGDFDRGPFRYGREQIWVARKA
jgi:hypothetical protein